MVSARRGHTYSPDRNFADFEVRFDKNIQFRFMKVQLISDNSGHFHWQCSQHTPQLSVTLGKDANSSDKRYTPTIHLIGWLVYRNKNS